jgi:prolyl-tRNA synthetase
MIGALIMAHSDDSGLVLPPKLAPIQVVIVPIYKSPEDLATVSERVGPIVGELRSRGISVKYDDDDQQRSGWKFAEHELKGVPVRLGLGMRDLENGTVEVARRDTLSKESRPIEGIAEYITLLLDEIQQNIYEKALKFREENTFRVDTWDEFKDQIEKGGFILAHWDGTGETEEKIKDETKATIRCIPLDAPEEEGICVYSGKPSNQRVVFARAY